MVATLSIMAAAALLSGLLPFGSDASVYAMLIVCRLCVGIGAGGECLQLPSQNIADLRTPFTALFTALFTVPLGSDASVYAMLIVCRLCIGIGAGGECLQLPSQNIADLRTPFTALFTALFTVPLGSDASVYAMLIFCRLCIGIGAGDA
jgi:hypothetical protein